MCKAESAGSPVFTLSPTHSSTPGTSAGPRSVHRFPPPTVTHLQHLRVQQCARLLAPLHDVKGILGHDDGDEAYLPAYAVGGAPAGEPVPAAEWLHDAVDGLQEEAQGRQDLDGDRRGSETTAVESVARDQIGQTEQ